MRLIVFLFSVISISIANAQTSFFIKGANSSKGASNEMVELVNQAIQKSVIDRGGNSVVSRQSQAKYVISVDLQKHGEKYKLQIDKLRGRSVLVTNSIDLTANELSAGASALTNAAIEGKKIALPEANVAQSASAAPAAASTASAVTPVVAEPAPTKTIAAVPDAPPIKKENVKDTTRGEDDTSYRSLTDSLLGSSSTGRVPFSHWFFGMGPVYSTMSLLGDGTKYDAFIAYTDPLAEYWDVFYYYDVNVNSATLQQTISSTIGLGITYYFGDRVTETSPYLAIDTGFGGANRYTDAGSTAGFACGVAMFRTRKYSFDIQLRYQRMFIQATNSKATDPGLTQLRLGLHF